MENMQMDTPEEEMMGDFKKCECEDALDTLLEAEEIKADPKLMEQVKILAEEQKKAISSITGMSGASPKAKSISDIRSKGNEMAMKQSNKPGYGGAGT